MSIQTDSFNLTIDEQIKILELSRDWYMVFSFDNNKINTIYQNTVCKKFCEDFAVDELCKAFSSLEEKIIGVYKDKQPIFIPEFVIKNNNTIKILDIQIYAINGHVILCGRDLEPLIYNLRTNAAMLVQKLDSIILEKNN